MPYSFKQKLDISVERISKRLSTEDIDRNEIIEKEAEKFKSYNFTQLDKEKVAAKEARADASLRLHHALDASEREFLQHFIELSIIREELTTRAIDIRRDRYYRKPSHKLSDILSSSGIFSTSTERSGKSTNKNPVQSEDESDLLPLVRQTGRANFYHPAAKDLTLQDAKVLIALHTIWEKHGKRKQITIPRTQLAKEMGISRRSKNYQDIYESLLTILETQIEFHYFYDTGRIATEGRTVILQDARKIPEEDAFFVRFGDTLFEQMQSGAMVKLSLAILEDLPSNTAKGMYIFLASQVVEGIRSWRLEELYQLMGLRGSRPKKRYDQIDSACVAMKDIGLFESYDIHESETGEKYLEIKPSTILLQSKAAWIADQNKSRPTINNQVTLALEEAAITVESEDP